MKKSTKILTMLLMLVITLSVFAVYAYAEGSGESGENITEEATKTIEVSFDFSRFVDSLQTMWKGMLCIFIVIGVIILAIYALNKAMTAIANRKSNDNN